jgi:hypothetical protein
LFIFDLVLIYTMGLRFITYTATTLQHDRMLEQIVSGAQIPWAAYRQLHDPRPIEGTGIAPVAHGQGQYDLVGRLRNVNEQWGARAVTFHFVVDGQELPRQTTVMAPGESKHVLSFNYEQSEYPQYVGVFVDGVVWMKVRGQRFLSAREQLRIEQAQYVPSSGGYDRVRFLAVNQSPYSFWVAGFPVVAFRGDVPVAAHYISTEQWMSQEAKELQAVWFEGLPALTNVEVGIDIDLLDEANIMPLEGKGSGPSGIEPPERR